MSKSSALAAYRHLLRAFAVAFKDDTRVLTAARQQISSQFRDKSLRPCDLEPAIREAEEVAQFLRSNVVQGKMQDDGSYKLNIHDETERGDNDTIRMGGKKITIDGKTCKDM
ncbi:hypothetical protein MAPG_10286 [Magnaporthiopsis poae ATCC 64411]|uniref:Mitochondrial zinc maintenance protein 1, mitochondrial n=1 Tax=Magnaporthiopsis poae (strain ATCC 64411 / 73-15) TaxID=644358 RepID=A0A0C4EC72_MAGP6|nr:hypothetical protein MAPG_10286 [Magnaporthiopsis poae ATCC 64411]